MASKAGRSGIHDKGHHSRMEMAKVEKGNGIILWKTPAIASYKKSTLCNTHSVYLNPAMNHGSR